MKSPLHPISQHTNLGIYNSKSHPSVSSSLTPYDRILVFVEEQGAVSIAVKDGVRQVLQVKTENMYDGRDSWRGGGAA